MRYQTPGIFLWYGQVTLFWRRVNIIEHLTREPQLQFFLSLWFDSAGNDRTRDLTDTERMHYHVTIPGLVNGCVRLHWPLPCFVGATYSYRQYELASTLWYRNGNNLLYMVLHITRVLWGDKHYFKITTKISMPN